MRQQKPQLALRRNKETDTNLKRHPAPQHQQPWAGAVHAAQLPGAILAGAAKPGNKPSKQGVKPCHVVDPMSWRPELRRTHPLNTYSICLVDIDSLNPTQHNTTTRTRSMAQTTDIQ